MHRADVVVVGAGVFGVWTALELQRRGLAVLLVDAWGVAHSRASSSGESRVIRAGYGDRKIYSEWVLYSLQRWKSLQRELERTLFVETGVLWFGGKGDKTLADTRKVFDELLVPHERLDPAELRHRFPQISVEGIGESIWEPGSGILLARFAVQQVAQLMVRQGGEFQLAAVDCCSQSRGDRLHAVTLQSGGILEADYFVFCCGPWMPRLFPEILSSRIKVSRQEVFFFGLPAGDQSYSPGRLPAWIDLTGDLFYGLPAVGGRSIKLACDETGPDFEPTLAERTPSAAELERVRTYLPHRFPALRDAPLIESRVCQYSRSADSHLIIDRHPAWSNTVLAGSGSGHGFKLGPAVARLCAELLLDSKAQPPLEVRLER